MLRLVVALSCLLLSSVSFAENRLMLVVAETIDIKAPPAKVWNFVKKFDGLKQWHPAFVESQLVSGRDGERGAIRALTIKDGPTFTEELLAINEPAMAFTYNVIESPLPIDHYLSTMTVKPNANGGSTVTWIGQFTRKNPRTNPPEGESDAGALGLITGAYQAGLQNLKKLMESGQ
ncbi:MAG TPA: SRPBCC family protein [Burkholderiales bacterium]|nr:SRPBCC family protein [Burkholderiales bacterium]